MQYLMKIIRNNHYHLSKLWVRLKNGFYVR